MSLVYSQHAYGTTPSWTYTPGTAPTAGNLLILSAHTRSHLDKVLSITGWTIIETAMSSELPSGQTGLSMFYRTAQAGDTAWIIGATQCDVSYSEWSGGYTFVASASHVVQPSGTPYAIDCGGAVAPGAVSSALIIGAVSMHLQNDTDWFAGTPDAGVTELDDFWPGGTPNGNPGRWSGYRIVASPSGTYTPGATGEVGAYPYGYAGITAAFGAGTGPPPPAEPPPYVPPPPARALLEIWAAEPGAPRWDVDEWDAAVWSSSSWQDVTPQGITADVSWGVDRPDAGILADTVAGVWTVITYDPDRILDPANAESPYATELVPGLPIRISHRGVVLRTGVVESMSYSHKDGGGEIRATDNIARLAAVSVPPASVLDNTLRARARDAIAAAGLDITVEPTPPAGDPALAPWTAGTFTAWGVIAAAAREVLHVPFLDNHGVLRFRAWSEPLDRGQSVSSPELVDLIAYVSDDSLVSVVQVNDYTGGIPPTLDIERRVTPLPRYGERIHARTLATINGDAWADAVLLDRAYAALRWRPGRIYCDTADVVERIAAIETLERIFVEVIEADPAILVSVRVLGIRLRVVDLGGLAGPDWSFDLQANSARTEPLIADGVVPIEYLIDDDTAAYLYPDGVVLTW